MTTNLKVPFSERSLSEGNYAAHFNFSSAAVNEVNFKLNENFRSKRTFKLRIDINGI